MGKILVACEESQTVCKAFRTRGHEAYSCDIQAPSGGYPEWHILGDALNAVSGQDIITMDGMRHGIGRWDLIIAHPPCTFLTVTGNRWFNVEKYGEKARKRIEDRNKAVEFWMNIIKFSNTDRLAIENPVGIMSTIWRKPDQIIQPYQFGDAAEKRTCLWVVNLPKLSATNIVSPPDRIKYKSGKTMPAWYADCWRLPAVERSKLRSKTFVGVANAMAYQWGGLVDARKTAVCAQKNI